MQALALISIVLLLVFAYGFVHGIITPTPDETLLEISQDEDAVPHILELALKRWDENISTPEGRRNYCRLTVAALGFQDGINARYREWYREHWETI